MKRRWILVAVSLAGCAARTRDPVADARAVARRAAIAVAARDLPAVAGLVSPGIPLDTAERMAAVATLTESELAGAAAALRAAAAGTARVHAIARRHGPLGASVVLAETSEGWRVDPETFALPAQSPLQAIEHLIAALERMETDPALLLLTSTLRDSIISGARDRARALREALPRFASDSPGRAAVHIEYGRGFFIVLRPDVGGWRVDDFN